jgi:hypothetical protein
MLLFYAGRGGWFCAPENRFLAVRGFLGGRGGVSQTTRPYHLYVLRPEGRDSLVVDGLEFVACSRSFGMLEEEVDIARLRQFWTSLGKTAIASSFLGILLRL